MYRRNRYWSGPSFGLGWNSFTVFSFIAVFIASAYGWVENIIKLSHFFQAHLPIDFLAILRVAGILLAPLGIVLGYI